MFLVISRHRGNSSEVEQFNLELIYILCTCVQWLTCIFHYTSFNAKHICT